VRDALAATKEFQGVTGKISINADRNAVKPAVVLKVENGKFVYAATINPKTSRCKRVSVESKC
jgi:branched-chain amino acid transport system substrate-binding protein